MNPLPPSFPVEHASYSNDPQLAILKGKIRKLFEENASVPQETKSNRISVGAVCVENCYYVPHNYRLIFPFSLTNFNPKAMLLTEGRKNKPQCGRILGFFEDYKRINHNSTHFFRFEKGSIAIKKKTAEVCTYINHKKAFTITVTTDADKQLRQIVTTKDKECISLLKAFIKKFGGASDFKILKRTSEDKVYGDKAIDSIDQKARFRNEVGKKVYNENNFEFSGVEFASNYIKNRAIEVIAPEIASELKKMDRRISAILPMVRSIVEINRQTSLILHELAQKELKKIEPDNQSRIVEYIN
jgi:hypothetical protein